MPTPAISIENGSKSFSGALALRDVSIELSPGEVHVLLGENGAGKSTLVNVMIGKYQLDRGQILIRGKHIRGYSASDSKSLGINAVLQDLSLAPTLRVFENMYLGRELSVAGFLRRSVMRRKAAEALNRLGVRISPNAWTDSLSRAEMQLVEIAKALVGVPGVLLLDEPTASISDGESEHLFSIVHELKESGWAILYITHRMSDIRRVGDRVTVLRDGAKVGEYAINDVADQQLIRDMAGRELRSIYPAKRSVSLGPELLAMRRATSANGRVVEASLVVRSGEIVGVAGLVGSGKEELPPLLFGMTALARGSITFPGSPGAPRTPRALGRRGVAYIPQDRRNNALMLSRSVADNITLEVLADSPYNIAGYLRVTKLSRLAGSLVKRLDVRPANIERAVDTLSGGNQQKVVLARALSRDGRSLIIVSEPTEGVDVGSRQGIYAILRRLCESGAGVLMISSDIDEIIGLSDRVYVMAAGAVRTELSGTEITDTNIVAGEFAEAPQKSTNAW